MKILITEITIMRSDMLCLAGWEAESRRMVRPLPNRRHWDAAYVDKLGILIGDVISIVPNGAARRPYPHKTEDVPIDPFRLQIVSRSFANWMGSSAPPVSESIIVAFGHQSVWKAPFNGAQKGYVPPGSRCASLIGIAVLRGAICLEEFAYNGRTQLVSIIDTPQGRVRLPVTARNLRDAWNAGGVGAAHRALPDKNRFHVRIGLANPFGEPETCAMMLNGVL